MGSKDLKTRDQIDKKYKWNIEAMIADESTIDKDLEDVKAQASAYAEEFSGKLTQSSSILLKAYKEPENENLYFEATEEYVETELKLIPYFAYENRGETDMLVWILKK